MARRSLNVWPLETPDVPGLKKFALTFLKLSEEEFASFEVRGIKPARGALTSGRTIQEFEVEFARIGYRDAFRSNASRLAPHGRNAGIWLTLPDFLMSTFKLLENEGYRITQRKPGTKRSIKFNDLDRTLVMDVKLPGANWVRVTADQVAKVSRGRRSVTNTTVDDVLAIGSLDLPEPVEGIGNDADEEMEETSEAQNPTAGPSTN